MRIRNVALVVVACVTAARAETFRAGSFALALPRGLAADGAVVPADDPPTAAKVALGRLLFFDPRLSRDGTIACASCHRPSHGFADPARVSRGIGGARGRRNAPAVVNRLFADAQLWDGRAADLEDQVARPLVDPAEMGNPTVDAVVARIRRVRGYGPWFARAFGDPAPSAGRIAQAIASFERTLVAGDSPFDRFQAGDRRAMRPAAVRGLALFRGKAGCARCHTGATFTDEGYNNVGVGTDRPDPDPGRGAVTGVSIRHAAFKTPSLRNVAATAPYMHDGSLATLADVVGYYDRGANPNAWLSPEIRPLHLTAAERADLVAFLRALTGPIRNGTPPRALPR